MLKEIVKVLYLSCRYSINAGILKRVAHRQSMSMWWTKRWFRHRLHIVLNPEELSSFAGWTYNYVFHDNCKNKINSIIRLDLQKDKTTHWIAFLAKLCPLKYTEEKSFRLKSHGATAIFSLCEIETKEKSYCSKIVHSLMPLLCRLISQTGFILTVFSLNEVVLIDLTAYRN